MYDDEENIEIEVDPEEDPNITDEIEVETEWTDEMNRQAFKRRVLVGSDTVPADSTGTKKKKKIPKNLKPGYNSKENKK